MSHQLMNSRGDYWQLPTSSSDPRRLPVHFRYPPFESLSRGNYAAAFLHGRRSPAGHERLVDVQTHDGFAQPDGTRDVPLCYGVYTLATWHAGSRPNMASFIPPHVVLSQQDHWQVFADQPDLSDESHFRIGYAINGQRGTIEGWLQDDERLSFHIKDGPATTRPTQGFR